MIFSYPKGGRGNKFAPGVSTVRVPKPLKSIVLAIIQKYKQNYGYDPDPEGELLIYDLYLVVEDEAQNLRQENERLQTALLSTQAVVDDLVETRKELLTELREARELVTKYQNSLLELSEARELVTKYQNSLLELARDLEEIATGGDPKLVNPNPSKQRSNRVKVAEIANEILTWVKRNAD